MSAETLHRVPLASVRRSARRRGGAPSAWVAALALASAACGSGSSSHFSRNQIAGPGAGVVFSYPADGQWDVPTGARLVLTFSEALPASPAAACSRDAAGQLTGTFCVEGPDGFVAGEVAVSGTVLTFEPAARLAAGATYQVWALPALLPGATNLPAQTPLLTFHTRSERIRAGQAATVLAVNGYARNADGSSPTPYLDVAPLRLLFSEPLDPATLTPASVRLVHAADGAVVDGLPVVHGVHLTFQPAAPLTAGDAYRLELTAAAHDLGGESITPVALDFTPQRTAVPGQDLYALSLDVTPAWAGGAGQPLSRLSNTAVNASDLASQLIGDATLGVLPGGLDAQVGNPELGAYIPMLLPRGQRLDLTSLPLRYGGVLESGLQTGTVHFNLLTDAVGYMRRNPFRPASQEPDDLLSPTWVEFLMDAVLTSEDAHGNTIASQTVLGIRVLGLSGVDGDQLVIDQVGALDFSLIGVDTAPIGLSLRLRTGTRTEVAPLAAPALVSSFPADGAASASPAEPIELNFTGPLDPARVRDGLEIQLASGGVAVATSTRLEGATLVIVPSRRLDEGAGCTLSWSGLRSLGGDAVASGSLSFTTAVSAASQPVPPVLAALVPGAPCALTGGTAGAPGHCVGGQASDGTYQPFTLPANRDVRALFSAPVDPASLTLGAACGQGSVRVEQVDANGRCAAVVEGTLQRRDRELRFVPNAPWTPGAAYRLTLVAGRVAGPACAAGGICGRNGRPLNTHPLDGAGPTTGGGPDVVIDFTGAPATIDTYQPLASDPAADQNGNGYLDAGERATDGNRIAMEIASFDGVVTSASLNGLDCLVDRPGQQVCSHVTATLPVSIGGVIASCPIDAEGRPSTAPNPCIEVRVLPNSILGTSISMSTTAFGIVPISNLPTGVMVMRLREQGAPIHGYILREPGVADPEFVIRQDVYVDTPDLSIPLATHDLASKPLSVVLKGPVTFRADGRMDVALRNLADVSMKVNISALLLPGSIDLRIPAGEMRITLAGPVLR